MYPVLTIADEMLRIAKRKGRQLTPMQLMKLVYIAHGWSLAVMGRDIFSDRIEAWKFGPVIPTLYQAAKRFGRDEIPNSLVDDSPSGILDEEMQAFLDDVFLKYGHLSGIQLSNLTHMAGTPWSEVYEGGMTNNEISDHLISRHYLEKLNEYRQQA